VRLLVADLGRSIDYYEGTLGLAVLTRESGRVDLGPTHDHVLVELHERRGLRPAARHGAFGLFHFAILLPDRSAMGRFLQHALALGVVSGLADHAVSEAAYLTDPDGLGIEVYTDRPREEWRSKPGGELHMTTEALNVPDVVAAGDGGVWQTAPPGTTMGHVHLHVGGLEEAEAFYHRAVGFDKTVWTYPGALFLSAGGYHHHLGTNIWARGGRTSDDQARLLSWDLETSDPDAVAESVTRGGYAVSRGDDGWQLPDPWGTVVRVRTVTI
jgi:catechol 2,3-dioxygenase